MHGRGNGSQCVHPAADPNAGLERPFSPPPAPAGFHARVGVTLRPQDAGRRRVRAPRGVRTSARETFTDSRSSPPRAAGRSHRYRRERHKTQLSLRKTKVRRHNRARGDVERAPRRGEASAGRCRGRAPSVRVQVRGDTRQTGLPPPATPRDQDSRVSAFAEAAPRALTTFPRPSQRRPPRARRTPTTRRLERETPRLRVSGLRGDR